MVDHIDHGFSFVTPLLNRSVTRLVDIGSGAGVPGLLLSLVQVDAEVMLLDGMEKRCAFLRSAVIELNIEDRVQVLEGRAENWARTPLRRTFDVVTARSFAAPAVTAECGVGFLKLGGVMVISEPPSGTDRWPPDGLHQLGLTRGESAESVAVLELETTHDRWPRRVGIPSKRPLF